MCQASIKGGGGLPHDLSYINHGGAMPVPRSSRNRLGVSLLTVAFVSAACGSAQASTAASTTTKPPAKRSRSHQSKYSRVVGTITTLATSTLTVKVASGSVTVALDNSTKYQQTTSATITDIVQGSCVRAAGRSNSIGNLQAVSIIITQPTSSGCFSERSGTHNRVSQSGLHSSFGSVVSMSGPTIEIQNPQGQVGIALSSVTKILQIKPASLSALAIGQCITASVTKTLPPTSPVIASSVTISTPRAGGCKLGAKRVGSS